MVLALGLGLEGLGVERAPGLAGALALRALCSSYSLIGGMPGLAHQLRLRGGGPVCSWVFV